MSAQEVNLVYETPLGYKRLCAHSIALMSKPHLVRTADFLVCIFIVFRVLIGAYNSSWEILLNSKVNC